MGLTYAFRADSILPLVVAFLFIFRVVSALLITFQAGTGGANLAYHLPLLSGQVEACLLSNPRMLLSAIARQLRVERHTIERAVRKATGKSFRHLQAEILSEKALHVLRVEPAWSIKQIAFLLGYKSGQAFSRFIKRTHKSSPTELRLRRSAKHATTIT